MTLYATNFQKAMDILKIWWLDGFKRFKVNGQHALCDAMLYGRSIPYHLKYHLKQEDPVFLRHFWDETLRIERGGRGRLHMHILLSEPRLQMSPDDAYD